MSDEMRRPPLRQSVTAYGAIEGWIQPLASLPHPPRQRVDLRRLVVEVLDDSALLAERRYSTIWWSDRSRGPAHAAGAVAGGAGGGFGGERDAVLGVDAAGVVAGRIAEDMGGVAAQEGGPALRHRVEQRGI